MLVQSQSLLTLINRFNPSVRSPQLRLRFRRCFSQSIAIDNLSFVKMVKPIASSSNNPVRSMSSASASALPALESVNDIDVDMSAKPNQSIIQNSLNQIQSAPVSMPRLPNGEYDEQADKSIPDSSQPHILLHLQRDQLSLLDNLSLKGGNNPKRAEPANFRQVYRAIIQHRQIRNAPVDIAGCERVGPGLKLTQAQRRFQILTSLMLSSQTKDITTAAAVRALNDYFADRGGLTVQNVLASTHAVIDGLICKVGFHNTKAKYLLRICEILHSQYNDDIPKTTETLMELPGVGPKMAYLAMQCAWNKSLGIGVDTHVHRVANRLGWCRTREAEDTRLALEEWMPQAYWKTVNILMVGFGQQICLPRTPLCDQCNAASFCPLGKRVLAAAKKGQKFVHATKDEARDRVPIKKKKKTVTKNIEIEQEEDEQVNEDKVKAEVEQSHMTVDQLKAEADDPSNASAQVDLQRFAYKNDKSNRQIKSDINVKSIAVKDEPITVTRDNFWNANATSNAKSEATVKTEPIDSEKDLQRSVQSKSKSKPSTRQAKSDFKVKAEQMQQNVDPIDDSQITHDPINTRTRARSSSRQAADKIAEASSSASKVASKRAKRS